MGRVSILQLKGAINSVEALRAMFPDPSAPKPIPGPKQITPDASLLPTMQQAAIVTMMVSQVKTALTKRLLVDAQDIPRGPDYRALVELGLAEHKIGKRTHDLTMQGRFAARALEQKLCQQHSIHLMIDAGQAGWEQRYCCPCGWRTRVRRSTTSDRNARIQFNRHVSTAAGMSKLFVALKPPARAEG